MKNEYYHQKASVEEYINLAKDVNSRGLIEKLRAYLKAQSTVLEIGSGPGTDWQILSESFQVIGSDYSPLFVERLQRLNPKGSFLQLDAISLECDQHFDALYSNKVFQHLDEEELEQSLLRQKEILNKAGLVCHSFWRGQGSENFKGMQVHYRQEAELRKLFEKHFEILLLESYAEFEKDDSLVIIGRLKSE